MTKGASGFAIFSCLVGLAAAACGGNAAIDGAGGGTGTAGASGTAGTTGTAGASGIAGAATSDQCAAAQAAGQCDAYIPSFWHNPKTGLCEPFVYGGCGGNANRFASRAACLDACPGGGSDWGGCQRDSDCSVTNLGCCAACEPINGVELLALSNAHRAEEYDSRCPSIPACAPCAPIASSEATGKYFRPVCVSGQCSVVDIRETQLTECKANVDCTLRAGVGCCEACRDEFVSVNSSANFCPDGPEPCPKCATPIAQGLIAQCTQGRCTISELLP